MSHAPDPEALLAFWFGASRTDPAAVGGRMGFWFGPSADDEAGLTERFGDWPARADAGEFDHWPDTPAGRLALILVCDQLPRTFERGTAGAFARDERALALSLAGVMGNTDTDLGLAERAFFYMPLQHSEDRLVQALSVQVHDDRLAAAFPNHREIAEGFAKYARLHRDIIERFGRYPHRNATLGRESTPQELEYLETGPRFGQ